MSANSTACKETVSYCYIFFLFIQNDEKKYLKPIQKSTSFIVIFRSCYYINLYDYLFIYIYLYQHLYCFILQHIGFRESVPENKNHQVLSNFGFVNSLLFKGMFFAVLNSCPPFWNPCLIFENSLGYRKLFFNVGNHLYLTSGL